MSEGEPSFSGGRRLIFRRKVEGQPVAWSSHPATWDASLESPPSPVDPSGGKGRLRCAQQNLEAGLSCVSSWQRPDCLELLTPGDRSSGCQGGGRQTWNEAQARAGLPPALQAGHLVHPPLPVSAFLGT